MTAASREAGPWPVVIASGLAFIGRELATYASYRAKLALGLASLALSLVTFSFVGKVVASAGNGFVEQHGMSYTSFAVIGVFVHSLAASGLHAFRSAVRREQLQGTLELLLTTRLPAPVLVFLAGSGELAITVLGGALVMSAAAALIGLDLRLSPDLALAFLLYLLAMCGLGLASAGVIMVSKEGEPVSWAVSGAAGLLGGVYFPVGLLPDWLQAVARALPTTHAVAIARYGSRTSSVLGPDTVGSLSFLALTALSSLTAGIIVLGWGCRRARSSGTLNHY
jgi:ABC-2 type transport system permease protein